MEIIWVRHAEPERIPPGTGIPANPSLTASGRQQAERLGTWLARERVDAILSSPLRRAIETAEPIAKAHGLTIEIVEGLAEYDRAADHYIPMEELRVTKDEEVEGLDYTQHGEAIH